MDKAKFAILGFGVLGLLAVFLPFVSFGDESVSLWKMRELMGAGKIYVIIAGFLGAAVMGGLALQSHLLRWQGIAASIGFALVVLKLRPWGDIFSEGAIGAKLMIISAFVGLAISIAATATAKAKDLRTT